MFKLFFLSILFFSYSVNSFSYCFLGYGTTCFEKASHYEDDSYQEKINRINIYNNSSEGGSYKRPIDGGEARKNEAGDKSKNQGYAEYKKNFVYIMSDFYSIPHQDGYKKSSDFRNYTLMYEYAFNPFISVSTRYSDGNYLGAKSSELKKTDFGTILNLRIYIMDNLVFRAGGGIGLSSIDSSSSEKERDYKEDGVTEIIQFSCSYLFGNENTFVGLTSTTMQGVSDDKNLGFSSYSAHVGIGF